MLIFNYLPPKIKFGAFRLKLAHKMQERPDPHGHLYYLRSLLRSKTRKRYILPAFFLHRVIQILPPLITSI